MNIGNKNKIYTKEGIMKEFKLTEKEYNQKLRKYKQNLRNYANIYDVDIEELPSAEGIINYEMKATTEGLYFENKTIENIVKTSSTKRNVTSEQQIEIINNLSGLSEFSQYQGFATFSQGFEQLEMAYTNILSLIEGNFDNIQELKPLKKNDILNTKGIKFSSLNPQFNSEFNKLNEYIKQFNKNVENFKNGTSKFKKPYLIYKNFIKKFMSVFHSMYENGYVDSD